MSTILRKQSRKLPIPAIVKTPNTQRGMTSFLYRLSTQFWCVW